MSTHALNKGFGLIVAATLTVGAVPDARADIAQEDILKVEALATDFAGLKPNEQVPDDTLVRVEFTAAGAVRFFQNHAFYLTGSDRAWGLVGPGKTTIRFKEPMLSVTLAARGSADGDRMGPIFKNAPLAEAEGLIHAVDANGRRMAPEKARNVSFLSDDAMLITFTGGISAIEIENRAATKNSVVVIGGIGITRTEPIDVNGSGRVDFNDLLAVLSAWGACANCPADVDQSRTVDFADLLAVLAAMSR